MAAASLFIISACSDDGRPSQDIVVPAEYQPAVDWVADNAVLLNSLDPADEDFSDLAPLAAAIGDADVVLLGEQTHFDGSTFLGKTRLIKFLHQEMGFDVLAFENPMFDMEQMRLAVQSGRPAIDAANTGMFGVWSRSSQMLPLFSYIDETSNSANPLIINGFDSQFSLPHSQEDLIPRFKQFLAANNFAGLTSAEWPAFESTLNDIINVIGQGAGNEVPPAYETVRDQLLAELPNLAPADALFDNPGFWLQIVRNAEIERTRRALVAGGQWGSTNMRDGQMAQNLIWLKDTLYPNQKVIVWAATLHTMRRLPELDTRTPTFSYEGIRTMGDPLHEHYGDDLYSIGFISGGGSFTNLFTGLTFIIDPPIVPSLEYLFLASESGPLGFLDLTSIPSNLPLLNEPLIGRPVGHGDFQAIWQNHLEAVLYVDRVTTSTLN